MPGDPGEEGGVHPACGGWTLAFQTVELGTYTQVLNVILMFEP